MPDNPSERLHEDRARALSFGGVAELYERVRPSYPPALIDALMEAGPQRVLDVGCGTGKAARLLIERGCDLLGVEPDPSMAAIARRHGIRVEGSTFETWDPLDRVYDLIVSGQAWHWVDPVVGVAKAGSLLRPGGHLGVFWNRGWPEKGAQQALDAVYRRFAPEIAKTSVALNPVEEPADRLDEFRRGGVFTQVEARAFPWAAVYDRSGWIDLIATHSDHVRLPDARRRVLLDAVGDAVDALGGTMTYQYSTLLVLAQRGI
ncbi:MAG: class I SAM-dependent methyltransferase [Candidatus Dormibacteria bacterium]